MKTQVEKELEDLCIAVGEASERLKVAYEQEESSKRQHREARIAFSNSLMALKRFSQAQIDVAQGLPDGK